MLEFAGAYLLVATFVMLTRSLMDEGRSHSDPFTCPTSHYVKGGLCWLPSLLKPIFVAVEDLIEARRARARYHQWCQVAWR